MLSPIIPVFCCLGEWSGLRHSQIRMCTRRVRADPVFAVKRHRETLHAHMQHRYANNMCDNTSQMTSVKEDGAQFAGPSSSLSETRRANSSDVLRAGVYHWLVFTSSHVQTSTLKRMHACTHARTDAHTQTRRLCANSGSETRTLVWWALRQLPG
jgi:hypothetical protein